MTYGLLYFVTISASVHWALVATIQGYWELHLLQLNRRVHYIDMSLEMFFICVNSASALTFYAYKFDPRGTLKPSWTEYLGQNLVRPGNVADCHSLSCKGHAFNGPKACYLDRHPMYKSQKFQFHTRRTGYGSPSTPGVWSCAREPPLITCLFQKRGWILNHFERAF